MSTNTEQQCASVSLIYHKVYIIKVCRVFRDRVVGGCRLEKRYCIDAHNPPQEEADKSNLAVGPAISAALRQIVFAEELQQMKLHSVLSSYRSFQWEKQNILEALTLCKHERLTGKNKAT